MGECGCVSNDRRYSFPGPDKSIYVLTLAGACKYCCSPPGITIERIEPGNVLYAEYKRGDFITSKLKFSKWPDSFGAAVITGMEQHEFIEALLPHLVGVRSDEMGENGAIDEAGAEVILEEAYADATFTPQLVKPKRAAKPSA